MSKIKEAMESGKLDIKGVNFNNSVTYIKGWNEAIDFCIQAYESNLPTREEIIKVVHDKNNDSVIDFFISFGLLRKEKTQKYEWFKEMGYLGGGKFKVIHLSKLTEEEAKKTFEDFDKWKKTEVEENV